MQQHTKSFVRSKVSALEDFGTIEGYCCIVLLYNLVYTQNIQHLTHQSVLASSVAFLFSNNWSDDIANVGCRTISIAG